jgi:hypothetical protein
MPDLLDRIRRELNARMRALRPVIRELSGSSARRKRSRSGARYREYVSRQKALESVGLRE